MLTDMPQDYNATLNLPKTEFPMRASLPAREPDMLRHDSKVCQINEFYWRYVVTSMQEEGLIRGLDKGSGEYDPLQEQLKDIQITPKGIEMLCDNRMNAQVDKLIRGTLHIG